MNKSKCRNIAFMAFTIESIWWTKKRKKNTVFYVNKWMVKNGVSRCCSKWAPQRTIWSIECFNFFLQLFFSISEMIFFKFQHFFVFLPKKTAVIKTNEDDRNHSVFNFGHSYFLGHKKKHQKTTYVMMMIFFFILLAEKKIEKKTLASVATLRYTEFCTHTYAYSLTLLLAYDKKRNKKQNKWIKEKKRYTRRTS